MTSLTQTFILANVFTDTYPPPIGRPPYNEDFVFLARRRVRAEVYVFAARYQDLRDKGFVAAQSLITAYRHYRGLTLRPGPSFCFDEAFFVVCNLEGIWAGTTRKLQVTHCRSCGRPHIVPFGSIPERSCPFCKPAHFRLDRKTSRDDESNKARVPPALIDGRADQRATLFEMQLRALKIQRAAEDLGARPRVVAALMSTMPGLPPTARPPEPTSVVRFGRTKSLDRWSNAVHVVPRAQYAIAATTFRRLVAAGFLHEEAAIGAYRHAQGLFRQDPQFTFDRWFALLSQIEGRWGVPSPLLDLVHCPDCESGHLVSRIDKHPAHCPFCFLVRCHTRLDRQAASFASAGPVRERFSAGSR